MRDAVRLYIGGRLADLDERSLIQLNYTAEDLSNPTTALTSYSRQLGLPATVANDAIFGQIWRLDRVSGPDGWQPTQRLPFRLLSGTGELLEAGFAQLQTVERRGDAVRRYTVILFGELAAVMHRLTYGGADDTRKLTLADLPYDYDLTFTIDATTVLAAWTALENDTAGKWQTLNFAPAYNGIPSENFDADKALATPADIGLPPTHSEPDGTIYQTLGGKTLVKLADKMGELDVKDLRSYLQRPVIRFAAAVKAMQDYLAGNGFTLELDPTFFTSDNPYWEHAWLTLPLLDTLTLEGGKEVSVEGIIGDTDLPLRGSVLFAPASMPLGSGPTTVTVAPELFVDLPSGSGTRYLGDGTHRSAFLVQLVAYDAADQVLARSDIQVYQGSNDGTTMASGSFSTEGSLAGNTDATIRTVTVEDGTVTGLASIAVTAQSPAYLRLFVQLVARSGSDPLDFYDEDGNAVQPTSADPITAGGPTVTSATAGSVARSGATITPELLLGGTATPADYLLSYAQMFGLHFVYDRGTRTLRLLTRNSLYADPAVIDIDKLIDRAGMEVGPLTFDARFYEFTNPAEGQYVDYYKTIFGEDYGTKRLNTGYEFNADHRQMLEGTALKGAAEVLERRKYFIDITEDGHPVPAPFVDAGNSYLLWDDEGKSIELDIPCPSSAAQIDYFNPALPTYDARAKVQLHGDDGDPLPGTDVLLFFCGMSSATPSLRLTDDTPEMATLNNNNPCWLLTGGTDLAAVPAFGRYYRADAEVHDSWDMGTPLEVDIPGLVLTEAASIYRRAWDAYLRDRYDADTRIVRARVDLRRFQVCADLLRRFWHFDNSLWVLNAITDYDPSSDGLTACEFVKVQDKAAYQSGQDYDEWNPLSPYTLGATPLSINFPASGGTVQLTIYGDDDWTVTGLPAWVTASQMSGGIRGTYTSTLVTLTAPSNTEARAGVVRIKGGGGSRLTLPASQEASNYTYAIEAAAPVNFSAAGGTHALALYGITYLNGVQTDRRLLTTADGVTLSKGAGDTYGQLSNMGLTIYAANLDTNPRAAIAVSYTASWNGATRQITVNQEANAKTLKETSTGYSATVALDLYENSGTTIGEAGGDAADIIVDGSYGEYRVYQWTSGAESTESTGTPWTGYTITVEGTGASLSGQQLEWASRGTTEGPVRTATVKVWNGATLLASVQTSQEANAIESISGRTATISHSAWAVSGDSTYADPYGDHCTLSTGVTYTATYTSGASAAVSDSGGITYAVTSGSGLSLSGSTATFATSGDYAERRAQVTAYQNGTAVADIWLYQAKRIYITIDGEYDDYIADESGWAHNTRYDIVSNGAVALGAYSNCTPALTLYDTSGDVHKYHLDVAYANTDTAAVLATIALTTEDPLTEGTLRITLAARYVTKRKVTLDAGLFTDTVDRVEIVTPAGTFAADDQIVYQDEWDIDQADILTALGISTTSLTWNFAQQPSVYGPVYARVTYGGATYTGAPVTVDASTGDLVLPVTIPEASVRLTDAGGTVLNSVAMAQGVDSLTLYVRATNNWTATLLSNTGGWLSAAPLSGGAGTTAIVLSCAYQSAAKSAVLRLSLDSGYDYVDVPVSKASDVQSIAYTVDDQTSWARVDVSTTDGQTGTTGTAYNTAGWRMDILISNDDLVPHTCYVAGHEYTVPDGDDVTVSLTYANIAALGGVIEITE